MWPEESEPAAWSVSPVAERWLAEWERLLGRPAATELARYEEPLSRCTGTEDDEARRRWLVVDWLLRVNTPCWLRTAGLTRIADELAVLPEIAAPETLATAGAFAHNAALAGNDLYTRLWGCVLDRSEEDVDAPVGSDHERKAIREKRRACWAAVMKSAETLSRSTLTMAHPAEEAAASGNADMPGVWRVAVGAITEATEVAVLTEVERLTAQRRWSWTRPPCHAAELVEAVGRIALRPAEDATRRSAHRLTQQLLVPRARRESDR